MVSTCVTGAPAPDGVCSEHGETECVIALTGAADQTVQMSPTEIEAVTDLFRDELAVGRIPKRTDLKAALDLVRRNSAARSGDPDAADTVRGAP